MNEDQAVVKQWRSVAYTTTVIVGPRGNIMGLAGKACGVRDDDLRPFVMYLFPLIWPEGWDWTKAAKERLDTFLDCMCNSVTGPCHYHRLHMEKWAKDDEFRIQLPADGVPDALRGVIAPPNPGGGRIILPS